MNLEDKRLIYYTLKSRIRKKKLNYKEISKKNEYIRKWT